MTAPDARNTCGLTARISRLASADKDLVERFIETLEERAAVAKEAPIDRIRRRFETARSRQT